MECKLRSINFRKVSDPRSAFWQAFRVTGISDDWYKSIIGVIVISLGTRRSAIDKPENTANKPGSADDKPRSAGDKPGSIPHH